MEHAVQDLNQRFEALHEQALESFKAGKMEAALSLWEEARTLCAGRPIQEQNVLTWMAECAMMLGDFARAESCLREIIEKKERLGLAVPNGTLARLSVVKTMAARRAGNSVKRKK